MPGGGLLSLVSFGAQNVLLSGNPEMTYFYKAFRRYSHFSMESTTLACDGPDELFFDKPITIRCKIQRVADLVSDMYLTFDLPDIYSKYVPERNSQYYFMWSRYIGAHIIDRISFIVGGQKIQEFDGTYIIAKALIDLPKDKLDKWRRLVGDTAELTNPGLGSFGGGAATVGGVSGDIAGYPIVFENPLLANGSQTNRPSIPATTLQVPIPFWFCEEISNAFPLIAMQYTEAEVQITLRPLQDLYSIFDQYGNKVRPNFHVNPFEPDQNPNNPYYGENSSSEAEFRTFLVDVGDTPPPLNTLAIYPRIQATYIYLTKQEQEVFASTPLNYLLTQSTRYEYPGLYNRQLIDLETHNMLPRLFIVPRRSDSIQYKNDYYNFTNWWTYPAAPYTPTPAYNLTYFSSGVAVPQAQLQIIRTLRLLGDGNELQEEKPYEYYTDVVPYKSASGVGGAVQGLGLYSFSLHSPSTQPAGSINTSKIRLFQIEIDPYILPINTNYVYNISIYVESYNFFIASGGTGGLKYAL